MQWLRQRGLVVPGVGALVPGGGYHIRHSSRMGLRRPLVGHLGQLEKGYLWLQGLETVEAGESFVIVCML